MIARRWPLATIAFGLATLAIFVAFNLLPDVRAAYGGLSFGDALSRFQRAETIADLERVFGAPPDAARLAAMDAVNVLDLYGFIPAYTLFLLSAAAMLANGPRRLFWLAFVPTLIGALADVWETSLQLRITADIANASAVLPVALWHWIKYFGLAVGAVATGTIGLFGTRKRFILAALAVIPLVATFAAYLGVAPIRGMTGAFATFWIALLVIAVAEAFRRRPASRG